VSAEHKNEGEVYNGKNVVGYWHALGSQLLDGMKVHLMGLLRQGLSLTQVMTHHKMHVRKMALKNEHVTRDTFVLPSNVRNLAKKRADELWQKYCKDPISVRMWVLENPNSIFFYVQHAPMDLNSQTQDDTPFTLGIQTPWQLEIMQKFGHGNAISFDATFGTNQSRVSPFCYCMKCHIINMFHNIVTNVGVMFFAIPFVHPNGV
jgi:hypothetical protein